MSDIEQARRILTDTPRHEGALQVLGAHLLREELHGDLERWSEERCRDARAMRWLQELIAGSLRHGRLQQASAGAQVYALLRWGAPLHAAFRDGRLQPPETLPTPPHLTEPKLRHDMGQLAYLRACGVLDAGIVADLEARYRQTRERLEQRGGGGKPLDEVDRSLVGGVFNRLLHLRPTPRVARALSSTWRREAVERAYLESRGGLVVIDDVLEAQAIDELRAFCLESTFWFANRYAHGRIGAFFHDGFACPLLVQIAEELREALPSIFAPEYPLSQVWAFKNTAYLPPNATMHADFSAVTANLWITPDHANLLPGRGGLTVHDVDAPLHWDFLTYNGRTDVIRSFLAAQGARTLQIPHRQNRMVIFNADLFHGTQEVRFKEDYPHHRINVSWLYGRREDDRHHRAVHASISPPRPVRPWRSASLRR